MAEKKLLLITLDSIAADLNKGMSEMKKLVAENAITFLNKKDNSFFPLIKQDNKIAFIGIGIVGENDFAKRLKTDYNADVFYFDYKQNNSRYCFISSSIKKLQTSNHRHTCLQPKTRK